MAKDGENGAVKYTFVTVYFLHVDRNVLHVLYKLK